MRTKKELPDPAIPFATKVKRSILIALRIKVAQTPGAKITTELEAALRRHLQGERKQA